MKIGVTGSEGLIGTELVKRGCTPIRCDITKPEEVRNALADVRPDVLIHCASLTDVKYCEDHFRESFDVNVKGTANVVSEMPKNSVFIYISTDHVFSGDNWFFNGYGEYQKPSPVNRYGFSKWGGELMSSTGVCRSIIVRSSRCFNYVLARPSMEKLKNGEAIIFTDLIKRSFLHINHFVDGLLYLTVNHEKYPDIKLIHIAGKNVFSYYLFWSALNKYFGFPGEIVRRGEKLENETPRPFRGGLEVNLARRIGIPLYSITDGFGLLKEGI